MTGDPDLNPYAAPSPAADRVLFEEEAPSRLRLASRLPRWLAVFIDTLLLVAVAVPMIVGLAAIAEIEEAPMWISLAVIPVLLFQAFQWYLVSTRGQSLAKQWLRIRIVRLSGAPPGFVQGVLIRSWLIGLASAIPFLGGIVSIVDALFIFRDDKRCLHDLLAGTLVVRV